MPLENLDFDEEINCGNCAWWFTGSRERSKAIQGNCNLEPNPDGPSSRVTTVGDFCAQHPMNQLRTARYLTEGSK